MAASSPAPGRNASSSSGAGLADSVAGNDAETPATGAPTSMEAKGGCCAAIRRRRILLPVLCLPVFTCLDIAAACELGFSTSRMHLVLLAFRLATLFVAPIAAIQLGSGAWTCQCCGSSARSIENTGLAVPLASSAIGAAAGEVNSAHDAELARMRSSYASTEANKWKKLTVLSLCFIAVTAQSVYTGTLVLTPGQFTFSEQFCIVAVVLAINVEYVAMKSIVDALSSDEGMLLPGLHEHPLTFLEERKFMRCGVCRERVSPDTGGYFAFECKQCDFIVCLSCYRKQQKKTNIEEGILRGDKGPKPMQDMTALQYFQRGLKLMWPFRYLLLMALSCVLIAQGLLVLTPNYRGDIINALIEQDRDSFTKNIAFFVVLSILVSQFQAIQGLGSSMVQRRIIYDTSVIMFKNLLRQDIVFFDGTMSGQLTSRMTNDLQTVVQPVQAFVNMFLASLFRFTGASAMCLLTSWRLTVLATTLIGPVIYLTRIYAVWARVLNTRIRANLDDANAIATESLRNIRTVRAFGANVIERLKFRGYIDSAMSAGTTDAVAGAGLDALTQYAGFAATVLILWYGGQAVLRGSSESGGIFGELTVGRLVTYNLYWDMLNNSIRGMTGLLNSLIKAASAAQRVFDIIDLEPDIMLDSGLPVPREEPLAVEFHNVCFTYQMRPGKQVLNEVNFAIHPGSTAAFVGKSGAGKSTLVNLILRFYDPQAGEILLNHRPLPVWCLKEHHRRVGVVTQETQVFCRPIHDNLIYGLPADHITDEMVIAAAQKANAHSFISEMEMGYKSMVGEGGSRLSGGQRQRLAIARAFLRQPSLLLLDEATSALDAESEGLVQEALEEMVRSMVGKCSVMLIAHRLSTVISADKIIVMEAGKDIEQGTHSELLEKDGAYASLVSAQLSAAANTISEEATEEPEKEEQGKGKGKRGKGKGKRKQAQQEAQLDCEPEADSKGLKAALLKDQASPNTTPTVTPSQSQESMSTPGEEENGAVPPASSWRTTCFKHRCLSSILLAVLACDMVASVVVGIDHAIFLWLCGLRVLLTLGGLFFGVQLGLGLACCGYSEEADMDATSGGTALQDMPQQARNGHAQGVLPLMASANTASTTSGSQDIAQNGSATTNGHMPTGSKLIDRKLAVLEQSADLKQKNRWKRNAVLVAVAVVTTVQSISCASHVVTAASVKLWEAASLLTTIICMNVQFVTMKRLVDKMTEEEGILVKGLHPHRLTFDNKAQGLWCKVCRERMGPRTGGYKAFTCQTCNRNFSCCLLCYRKQQAKVNSEEGLLRSDKGPRPPLELSSKDYVVRTLRLIRPYRYLAGTAIVSVFIVQLGLVMMPNYRGNIFDSLIQKKEDTFERDLEVFIVVTVVTSMVQIIKSFSTQLTQRSVSYKTREFMFESLLRQDVALFDGTTTGTLTSRMTNDVSAVVQPVYQILNNILANTVKLIGGIFMCFHTSWELTVLCCTLVFPVIYTTRLYALWAKDLYLTIRIAMADANSVATESLRNIRIVRAFAADEVELGEYSRFINTAARGALKDAWAQAGVQALNGYLTFASVVIILWFGGLAVLNEQHTGFQQRLTIGQLITYNLYWDMMQNSIQEMTSSLNMLIRAGSAAQRVFEVIDLEPDINQESGDALPQGTPLAVRFENVKFRYQMRPDKQVLKGLSFELPPGQTVAVVGRSGAGKSTLVSLILRFYDPQDGQVLLNDKPLPEWRLLDFIRRVGVVSQETQIFCRPIIDNLLYGLREDEVQYEEVVAAGQKANAHDFICDLDQGYRSMVGEGGVRLSGGQKQRLAIARALLRKPTLLLLDEATSALDAVNEALVQEALETMVQTMAGNCSVMLIAHRLSTVRKSDNIVVMDNGQVAESGKHEELLGSGGVYSQLVQRQIAAQANTIAE